MNSVRILALQRVTPDHLSLIAPRVWEQFSRGGAPLGVSEGTARERRIEVLLLTLRDGVCEEIDPILVDVDENGYLVRWDVQLRPLPRHPALFDARGVFLRRYLHHARQWQPTQQLIDQALALAGRSGIAG